MTRMIKIAKIEASLKKCNEKSFLMVSKYGRDGCSGFNPYKQKFDMSQDTDKSVSVTSVVPVCLKTNSEDSQAKTVWQNERTSSTKLCRPIKFDFVKETKEIIKLNIGNIDDQIKQLQPTYLVINDEEFEIRHKLLCTMIDGKVIQCLMDTSLPSVCVIWS